MFNQFSKQYPSTNENTSLKEQNELPINKNYSKDINNNNGKDDWNTLAQNQYETCMQIQRYEKEIKMLQTKQLGNEYDKTIAAKIQEKQQGLLSKQKEVDLIKNKMKEMQKFNNKRSIDYKPTIEQQSPHEEKIKKTLDNNPKLEDGNKVGNETMPSNYSLKKNEQEKNNIKKQSGTEIQIKDVEDYKEFTKKDEEKELIRDANNYKNFSRIPAGNRKNDREEYMNWLYSPKVESDNLKINYIDNELKKKQTSKQEVYGQQMNDSKTQLHYKDISKIEAKYNKQDDIKLEDNQRSSQLISQNRKMNYEDPQYDNAYDPASNGLIPSSRNTRIYGKSQSHDLKNLYKSYENLFQKHQATLFGGVNPQENNAPLASLHNQKYNLKSDNNQIFSTIQQQNLNMIQPTSNSINKNSMNDLPTQQQNLNAIRPISNNLTRSQSQNYLSLNTNDRLSNLASTPGKMAEPLIKSVPSNHKVYQNADANPSSNSHEDLFSINYKPNRHNPVTNPLPYNIQNPYVLREMNKATQRYLTRDRNYLGTIASNNIISNK